MSYYVQSSMDRYVQRNRDRNAQIPSAMDQHKAKPIQYMQSNSHPNGAPPLKRSLSNASAAFGSHQQLAKRPPATTTTTTNDSSPAPALPPPKRMQLRTGSIEQLLQWRRDRPQPMDACAALCETFARLVRIVNGPKLSTHRVLLLRDDAAKPVLAGHYYGIDFDLPANVQAGAMVRCVGAFMQSGQFQVYKCRCVVEAGGTADDKDQRDEQQETVAALLARLTALSDHAMVAGAREEAAAAAANTVPALMNKL